LNKNFGLSFGEWLSLLAAVLVVSSLLFGLQQLNSAKISIQGSPRYIASIGPKGSLKNPLAVTYFADKIAVTSSNDGKVKLFTAKGKEINTLKLPKGSYPASLAVSENGTLYIGDLAKKQIFVSSFSSDISELEKLKIKTKVQPIAMAVHNDNLLIFDGLSQKIKILKDNEKFINFVTDKKLNFSYVNGIISDGNSVYIADSNSRRLLSLGSSGEYKATLKNFSLPRGIALDSLKRLHVVDTFVHTVKVFSSKGNYLFNYGEEGSGNSNLYFPNGIAIDSNKGRVYIADKGNNRVQVWGW